MSWIVSFVSFVVSGIACALPIAALPFMVRLLSMQVRGGESEVPLLSDPDRVREVILLATGLLVAWLAYSVALTALCVLHVCRSRVVPPERRTTWAFALVVGASLVAPVYWLACLRWYAKASRKGT